MTANGVTRSSACPSDSETVVGDQQKVRHSTNRDLLLTLLLFEFRLSLICGTANRVLLYVPLYSIYIASKKSGARPTLTFRHHRHEKSIEASTYRRSIISCSSVTKHRIVREGNTNNQYLVHSIRRPLDQCEASSSSPCRSSESTLLGRPSFSLLIEK